MNHSLPIFKILSKHLLEHKHFAFLHFEVYTVYVM